MAGYQFIHVEAYGREGSALKNAKRAKAGTKRKKGSGGWSALEICAEALREFEASQHVKNPLDPEMLLGDLQSIADDLEKIGPAPKGERKDTPILIAGIASAPWPPGDPRSKAWRADTVEHLKTQFGSNLRAVVGHNDEPFDHIHFYAANPDYAPIKNIHRGMKARDEVKAQGGTGYKAKAAFDNAMRDWQDQYFAEVAIAHGQSRLGPGRLRLSRPEWKSQQVANDAFATAIKTVDLREENAQKSVEKASEKLAEVAEIEARSAIQRSAKLAEIEVKKAELGEFEKKLKKDAKKLKEYAQKVDEKSNFLDRFSEKLKLQEQALLEAFRELPGVIQEKLTAIFARKNATEATVQANAGNPPPDVKKPPKSGSGGILDALKTPPDIVHHQKPK